MGNNPSRPDPKVAKDKNKVHVALLGDSTIDNIVWVMQDNSGKCVRDLLQD